MNKLNSTLQENLATLLAHDDANGRIVANLVEAGMFEGELRTIAERCIDYWHQHNQAPKVHVRDLFHDILDDPKQERIAQTYNRIFVQMIQLYDAGLNVKYVTQQVGVLKRSAEFKVAILHSAERIKLKPELMINEVEEIWSKLLYARQIDFTPGISFHDYDKVLKFLEDRHSEFRLGIKELDERNFVPTRSSVMMFLAATGRGKTWFLVHTGAKALLQGKRVAHVTLELSEEETLQRYYQNIFSVPKRKVRLVSKKIDVDEFGRIRGLSSIKIDPDFTFSDPQISDEISTRVGYINDLLRVKKFPMRSLTINGLRGYLDNLEIVGKFIPDMLILDYIGITKTDTKDHWLSLGRNGEDFHGVCDERNVAGVIAQQIGREGSRATTVRSANISEAWSLTNSADQILLHSCTDAEFKLGLARIYVDKARSEEDKFGALISQNYKIGQYCIDSVLLPNNYFDCLDDLQKQEKEEKDV